MPRLIAAILTAILLIYPIGVYFGLQYLAPKYIGLILFLILVARFVMVSVQIKPAVKAGGLNSLLPITVSCGLLCLLVVLFNDSTLIRINPVLINLILLLTFAYTLFKPPSMIERFARLAGPDLPDEAISYTRNVTKVWCIFFITNGLIALYTCFYTSLEVWTLYNGLIAYLLMGLLFLFEYLYRYLIMKKKALG